MLYVPGLSAPPLQLRRPGQLGANAIVAGYPLDGPFTAVPARVGGIEQATGPNIYQTAQVNRQIYPIRALVEPGNSGGPLLAPGGRVYGVVFAAATSVPNTGYALTAQQVASRRQRRGGPPRGRSPPRAATSPASQPRASQRARLPERAKGRAAVWTDERGARNERPSEEEAVTKAPGGERGSQERPEASEGFKQPAG